MDKIIESKILESCAILKKLSERTVLEIPELKYIPTDYKSGQQIPKVDKTWKSLGRTDRVCGKDKHFWLHTEVETPPVKENERLVFQLTTGREGDWDGTNPQGMVYLNGELVQGLDINHRQVPLEPEKKYDIMIYFYVGMIESYIDVYADIKKIDIPVRALYYDIRVPYDASLCFDDKDYVHIKTIKHLEQACNRLDFRDVYSSSFYRSIEAADKYIKEEYFEKECGSSDAVVSYIGHTHIDVAWLWTLDQTREKVQRSFATVLSLMKRYPEYVFMSSQPQLYEYLKEEAPELFEQVKERIKEGRWEADGAMWLEADCNLSSGESLIRQIMHGKQFMKQELGVDSHILWLPDVFGYSAAMPQIMKKTGVDRFVTSKISWNDTDRVPYDTFMWQGIDGSEIFTHFLTAQSHENYKKDKTETTYVVLASPSMNLGTWERYQQKEYNNETIATFGYGDGGGGPTEEMIETIRRMEYGLPGMPKAQMSFAGDFLDRVKSNFDKNCKLMGRTPKWVGELYLEFHRGTYTSVGKNKRNNRECEFLCQDTEALSVIGKLLLGKTYPSEQLYRSWRTILLNQFHDIIPGSSIHEVYEESDRQYLELKEEVGSLKEGVLEAIAANVEKKGQLVYNPNAFEVSGYVKDGDSYIYAENVPAMGWTVLEQKECCGDVIVSDRRLESEHYMVSFDSDMNIISIYDKDNAVEVVEDGKKANQLTAFEDRPESGYDNWEISSFYKQKKWEINEIESVTPIIGNGFGGYEIVRPYMSSMIKQRIIIFAHSRRIDFETTADWHENHVLLKTIFPTTVHTSKASYDIQFGSIERPTHENTSWDKAKFEVCAQKWGDLSDAGYGVSLLNNCKYGYSAAGSEMTLSLIKCGEYPDIHADQGIHEFTYSLLPHSGGFRQGGTIKEAYLLNRPLVMREAVGGGSLNNSFSLVNCDCENIIIETLKQSEDGKGIVIRMYDSWDKRTHTTINLGFDAKKIYLCDMLENKQECIGSGSRVDIDVANFEIITLYAEL